MVKVDEVFQKIGHALIIVDFLKAALIQVKTVL